jgi:hypothetical protein
MEIWEPKPPGTLWDTAGLLRDTFTFAFLLFQDSNSLHQTLGNSKDSL